MCCDEKFVCSVCLYMFWGFKFIFIMFCISEFVVGGFMCMFIEVECMKFMGMSDEDFVDFVEWLDVIGCFLFIFEEMMVVEDWFIFYMKSKNILVLFGFYKVVYFDDEGMLFKYVVWICDKYMKYGVYYGIL